MSSSRLTREFLRNHPDDAARVLERLPTDMVAALLAELPARLAAPALGAMLPGAAGRCLTRLAPATAGALLAQLRAPRAGALLRQLSDSRSEAIYRHVPTAHAARIRRARSFPQDSVGAWSDNDVCALTPQQRAREASEQLRAHGSQRPEQVYVIDRERRLVGTVAVNVLLHADRDRPLATLVQPVAHSLSTRTSLAAARRHRGWAQFCTLPVIEPNGQFVGELRLSVLHQPAQDPDTGSEHSWSAAFDLLGAAYCATAYEFLRGAFSWCSHQKEDDRDAS